MSAKNTPAKTPDSEKAGKHQPIDKVPSEGGNHGQQNAILLALARKHADKKAADKRTTGPSATVSKAPAAAGDRPAGDRRDRAGPSTSSGAHRSALQGLYPNTNDDQADYDTWTFPGFPGYPSYPPQPWMMPMHSYQYVPSGYVGSEADDEADDCWGDDDDDGGENTDPAEQEDHGDHGDDDAASDGTSDDPLSILGAYRRRYADEDGPPVEKELATAINGIWGEKRAPQKVKAILEKYPRPSNVNCHKVDINSDVLSAIGRVAKNRDAKLRSVQGNIARCAVPAVKLAEGLLAKQVNKTELIETALDTVTLLANANAQLNQLRRDALKPGLQARYQSLCKVDEADDTSQWLLGSNLNDRIKSAAQGGKLVRRGQYMPPGQSYMYGRGRRGHPYAPSYGAGMTRGAYSYGYAPYHYQGRGTRPFLGKSAMHTTLQTSELPLIGSPTAYLPVSTETNAIKNEQKLESHQTKICTFSRSTGPRPENQDQGENGVELPAARAESDVVGKSQPSLKVDKWGPKFKAGRVSLCVGKWSKITSDRHILGDIRGYKLEFTEEPKQDRPMPEIKFTKTERKFVRQEIRNLKEKEVLVEATHVAGEYISNIFLREKREPGKYRMILNLKHLNKFVEKKHFKMDTLQTTLALVTPGCTFMSFDFSDAYYSCSVFPPHRKYLRFMFEGQLYEFTCLPNGLSTAPRFFTKIMKVALAHLREKGQVTISGYLDDNILVNYGSTELAIKKGIFSADTLQELGFTINIPKSVITAVTVIEHLGFIIDSTNMQVTMTLDKTTKILDLITLTLDCDNQTIRQLARVIGKVNATKPANRHAPLLTKNMEIEKNFALIKERFNYDATMTLSREAREDLIWLTTNLGGISAPIRQSNPDYVINTDASNEGWGCYDPQSDTKSGGRWNAQEQEQHINTLELKAIWFGILTLVKGMMNIHVRIMTDNTTAVACINKQGSTKSQTRNKLTRQIWEFAMKHNLWLSAAHIPGCKNVEADEASRVFNDCTEWTLRSDIFQRLVKEFGEPSIDLFASRLNHKVERYCAWEPDPGAVFIDCFMYDWGQEELAYAFPPFSVIHMVVQKLVQDQAEVVMVVPVWPTQPWFTLLQETVCAQPMVFDIKTNELFLPYRKVMDATTQQQHPLAGNLQLMAVRCSAKHWLKKGSPPVL